MAASKKVDYDRIEPDWRAGIKSPRQLADEYTEATKVAVSHAAIIKHFKKLGIPRDLSEKIKAKAESMVTESMVTGKVTTATTISDLAIIDQAALSVATVQLTQRKDVIRARDIATKLFEELALAVTNPEELNELAEYLATQKSAHIDDPKLSEKEYERLIKIYTQVTQLPMKAAVVDKLAVTLKNLIGLEREAFGIDKKTTLDGNGSINISF